MRSLRIYFFGAIFLFSTLLSAQVSIQGQLNWQSPVVMTPEENAPFFEGASFSQERPLVPEFCERQNWDGPWPARLDVDFTSVNYQDATAQEVALLKDVDLPEYPEIQYNIGTGRSGRELSVCVESFVRQQGQLRKLTRFTLEVRATPVPESAWSSRKASAQQNSVLDAGGWHKISVRRTGLHRITPAFLRDNNIASGNVAISDIRVVGNGLGMLPEPVNQPRPQGLLEVPLQVVDQNGDGIFNENDYAFFYAHGPHQWRYDAGSGRFLHQLNTYRTRNFYFISVSNGPGLSVNQDAVVSAPADEQVTTFDDYDFEEEELYNLVGTGRDWYGHLFDFNLSYTSRTFSFPNLATNEPVRVRVRAAARASTANTQMQVSLNGQPVGNLNFPAYATGTYAPHATVRDQDLPVNTSSGNLAVQLQYDNSANPSGIAWLDFVELQVRRNLTFGSGPLYFRDSRSVGSGRVVEYQIANAPADLKVWEVTDHQNVVEVPLNINGNTASFKREADSLRQFVAFTSPGTAEPDYVKAVSRQNLSGLPAAEMLVITHPKFMTAAQRLADFHQSEDGISSHVVTTEEVFNEFGSGGQDIVALRDFARSNHLKAQAQGEEFNYLLLFGRASYDYKNILSNNTNYVPVYQGGNSLSLGLSFITDDFFGYLDNGEGGSNFDNQILDVGIGRIPCITQTEANDYVDKVIHYSRSKERFGDWRNKILLLADDVDVNWETMFVTDSEVLENILKSYSKSFNVDKVYSDAYDQVSTTGSERYPDATDDLFRKIQQGNLVTNYIGHGGEIGLSSEKLITLNEVNNWSNLDAMPLFVTITCEFSRLDDPKRISAGEKLALNSKGGAIGLMSTTRVVPAFPAVALNKAIFRTIFERPNNQPKTLGAIMRDAKNDPNAGGVKTKFSLLGDPALRLAIPYYSMQINEVNNTPVITGNLDTLKALSKITVTGQVNDFNDQKLANFDGVCNVTVYDKASDKATKRNDNVGPALKFTLQNNLIYRGKVGVNQGDFSFSFIVPKDISYKYGYGKFSLYAENGQEDAAGYMDTIVVGGINNDAEDDNEGPVIELYINDESFVRGGVTDQNPDLYALLSDSSGINTMGTGIGHDMIAVLNEETEESHVLNEYYEADLDSYQSGSVRYPFFELEEGEYRLKMRAFDVHNNRSEAFTEFIVANSEGFALERVLNYPNPFTTYTEFQFEHNRADQPLEVQVQIFTVSGKLVKTINELVVSQGNRVSGITWNGLDDYGDKIGKGVYVYRVKVRSQLDNASIEKYEKLVILR